MQVLIQIGLVAIGSAVGGLCRWGVGIGAGHLFGTVFPWGTFFINISGSLFLGWFATVCTDRLAPDWLSWISLDHLKLLVAVGFTGAYTTFSTFEYEAYGLLSNGDGILGFCYIFGSLFLGLVGVWLGVMLARIT